VWVSVAMVALNLPLNIVLVLAMRHVAGLALSTTICACLHSMLLAVLLRKRLGRMGGRRILKSVLLTVAASAAMGLAVWAVQHGLTGLAAGPGAGWLAVLGVRAVRVLAPTAVGVIVFYLAARLLRIAALRALLAREA